MYNDISTNILKVYQLWSFLSDIVIYIFVCFLPHFTRFCQFQLWVRFVIIFNRMAVVLKMVNIDWIGSKKKHKNMNDNINFTLRTIK